MTAFVSKFKNYLADKTGNFAIMTALGLPIGLLAVFGALDYGMFVSSQQKLKAAASSAALVAINDAQIVHANQEEVDLETLVKEKAESVFMSRSKSIANTELTSLNVIPQIVNNRFSVDIQYKAKVTSNVKGIVGNDSYKIADSQSAEVAVKSYINVTLLFDASASMAVGATREDQDIMRVAIGCAFGCHDKSPIENSSYGRAKAAGATMRIDVAKDAAVKSIDVIRENSTLEEQATFQIYKFAAGLEQLLANSDSKTSDLSHVKTVIENDVVLFKDNKGTNTEVALERVAAELPDGGAGLSANDRIQYLIVFTDGVEHDVPGSGTLPTRKNKPFFSHRSRPRVWAPGNSGCAAIRERNINILFIQTDYLTPNFGFNQHWYRFIDNKLTPILSDRLSECTGSERNVIKANTPQEIEQAFKDAMGSISTPLRLY